MLSLDLKFLTSDELIQVKNEDLRTYRYEAKKKNEENLFDKGKKSYCERRGGYWRAPRPRALRELESKLRERTVIFCEFMTETVMTLVFSSGTIAYLTINPSSLDITKILFDRYCSSKVSAQVVRVVFSSTHILLTHTEYTATLISFGKSMSTALPCRIIDRNPHVQPIELVDGARRAERRISWAECSQTKSNNTILGPRVLIWTAASADPAPWSPGAELKANLYLYQINGQNMNVVAYHQLENETLSAEVSRNQHNVIHVVEQFICQKNGAIIEWIRYDLQSQEGVVRLSSYRIGDTRVSLPCIARVVKRSDCDLRLLVSCIDGSLHIIHQTFGLTHSARVAFIPTEVFWCNDVITCSEEGGKIQCFDRALTLLQHSAKYINLTQYRRDPPRMRILSTSCTSAGALFLTLFANGPLFLLRVTHPQLPLGWIRAGRMSRAVAWLRAMDWENEGDQCLYGLQCIGTAIRRHGMDAGGEASLQAALGTFLARDPTQPGASKYRAAVLAVARLFFHQLLRRGRLDKALSLAVDIGAWDLFADAKWAANKAGLQEMADEAQALADQYAAMERPESECSGTCSCSNSSCSHSGDESSNNEKYNKTYTKPPPLPRVSIPTTLAQKVGTFSPKSHTNTPTIVPISTSLLPVPINQHEPTSTNSIRPNLHQYLERDLTIWNTEIKEDYQPTKWQSLEDVLNERPHIDPRSLRNKSADMSDKFVNSNCNLSQNLRVSTTSRYQNYTNDRGYNRVERMKNVEKNVKFSDTVTIAVVTKSHDMSPEPSRELAQSLPICAPHAYLAAFEPAQPGTTLDYVEV